MNEMGFAFGAELNQKGITEISNFSKRLKEIGDKLVDQNILDNNYKPIDVVNKLNVLFEDYKNFKLDYNKICSTLKLDRKHGTPDINTVLKAIQQNPPKKKGLAAHFSRLGRSVVCVMTLGFAHTVE